MAYHSFPWCGDAWLALDILTPSPKKFLKIFLDVAHERATKAVFWSTSEGNIFRLFSTSQNNIILLKEHMFFLALWKGWNAYNVKRTVHRANQSVVRTLH